MVQTLPQAPSLKLEIYRLASGGYIDTHRNQRHILYLALDAPRARTKFGRVLVCASAALTARRARTGDRLFLAQTQRVVLGGVLKAHLHLRKPRVDRVQYTRRMQTVDLIYANEEPMTFISRWYVKSSCVFARTHLHLLRIGASLVVDARLELVQVNAPLHVAVCAAYLHGKKY